MISRKFAIGVALGAIGTAIYWCIKAQVYKSIIDHLNEAASRLETARDAISAEG